MSTFNASKSFDLSSYTPYIDATSLWIEDNASGKTVFSHDLTSSSIAVKVINGSFAVGSITWSGYYYTRAASQNGPCAGAKFSFVGSSNQAIITANDDEGMEIVDHIFDIDSCPVEFWSASNIINMKVPCDGSSDCQSSGSSCYSEINRGNCN